MHFIHEQKEFSNSDKVAVQYEYNGNWNTSYTGTWLYRGTDEIGQHVRIMRDDNGEHMKVRPAKDVRIVKK